MELIASISFYSVRFVDAPRVHPEVFKAIELSLLAAE